MPTGGDSLARVLVTMEDAAIEFCDVDLSLGRGAARVIC